MSSNNSIIFRIVQKKTIVGKIYFIVQQKWLGLWWKPSLKYGRLVSFVIEKDYRVFASLEEAEKAIWDTQKNMDIPDSRVMKIFRV